MEGFRSQFTQIKGISARRRLPRLGKIRLGVKAISKKSGKEYPKETSYFVVPPEVARVYGDQPTILDVMFPMNDVAACFPQMYAHFGKSRGIKCMGDGENALRYNDEKKTMEPRECPCEKLETKECSQRAFLRVILPKVNMGGIYQVDIGSINSITDINSGIDYIRALMMEALGVDRFALIPLTLERKPIETHHEGQKQTHYTLRLYPNITIDQLNKLKGDNRLLSPPQYALPAPVIENPAIDEGAVVEIEEDEQPNETHTEPLPSWVEEIPVAEPFGTLAEIPGLTAGGAIETLEDIGMVEKPKKKTSEKELLKQYQSEISRFPTEDSVKEWWNTNCRPLKQELSEDGYWELTKFVTRQIKSLKGGKHGKT